MLDISVHLLLSDLDKKNDLVRLQTTKKGKQQNRISQTLNYCELWQNARKTKIQLTLDNFSLSSQ